MLLTHGHLDHSSGLAYHISQRSLRHLPGATIYSPPSIAPHLREIMRLWSTIEEFEFDYNLIPVEYDQILPLKGNFYFSAFPTLHRIDSCAYTIFERRVKLKEEFRHLPGNEISTLKKQRNDLFFETGVPIVTFSGDTRIEFILENQHARDSKVLFLECTYIDEKRSVERARTWGHVHLDEIATHAESFRNVEKLFLIHFSPRYRHEEIRRAIKAKLPEWLAKKTVPFI